MCVNLPSYRKTARGNAAGMSRRRWVIYSSPGVLLRFLRPLAGLTAAFTPLALAGALEPCRNRFRLGAPTARSAAPTPLPVLGGLAAAVGAVRRLSLAFLDLFALRSGLPRLDDR